MELTPIRVLIITGAVIAVILALWYIREVIRLLVTGALRMIGGIILVGILVAALAVVVGQWRPNLQGMLEEPRAFLRAWFKNLKTQAARAISEELRAAFRAWLRENLPLVIGTPTPRRSPLPTGTPSPAEGE